MARLIDADKIPEVSLDPKEEKAFRETIAKQPTVNAIPIDFIWDRAEFYEKQWIDNDNHWAKNVAEALRALLEDWDGEVGDILEQYENS